MKLLKRLQLLWMYLTEYRYEVVNVTPQNVYRIRKYYKRLPNIRKKYVMAYYINKPIDIYETVDECLALRDAINLRQSYIDRINKLVDKINEKETPV